MADLFTPYELKGISIKNRIVMPPMVCFGWAGREGLVTEKHIRHYEARARGGVGLIILEAACVNPDGRLADSQLCLWSDDHIKGFEEIARACHRYGARVLVQIHHAGLQTAKKVSGDPVAPSEVREKDRHARALTPEEIHSIQEDFTVAAVRAEKAGLDGIELHGAHGYLISQFMSPVINKREDQYGGSLENRTRFALEILAAIKGRVGNRFIIGYRMGGNEPTLENGIAIARILEQAGVDLLHVSTGISAGKEITVPEGFPYNWIVYSGTRIKEQVKIPVIAVNGIRTAEQAGGLIENGLVDFAAIGRGLLADPEWANKAQKGEEALTCLHCKTCFWAASAGQRCPRARGRA